MKKHLLRTEVMQSSVVKLCKFHYEVWLTHDCLILLWKRSSSHGLSFELAKCRHVVWYIQNLWHKVKWVGQVGKTTEEHNRACIKVVRVDGKDEVGQQQWEGQGRSQSGMFLRDEELEKNWNKDVFLWEKLECRKHV